MEETNTFKQECYILLQDALTNHLYLLQKQVYKRLKYENTVKTLNSMREKPKVTK